MPHAAADCAQVLFAQLRTFDDQHVDEVLIEAPPAAAPWDGVRDRLRRASAR
jgi:L-threonylcarbamoyladenylate synthase